MPRPPPSALLSFLSTWGVARAALSTTPTSHSSDLSYWMSSSRVAITLWMSLLSSSKLFLHSMQYFCPSR